MTDSISFSFCWSEALGRAINKRAVEPYPIACWPSSDDHKALAAAINVGIDSHLEAVSFATGTDHRGAPRYTIEPESVAVLVRRLLEGDGISSELSADEQGKLQEAMNDLASGICSTLEIELI